MTAKVISKVFKLFCVLGIVVTGMLKWRGMLDCTIREICVLWAVAYGLGAGTIDFNIILDKFLGEDKNETVDSNTDM